MEKALILIAALMIFTQCQTAEGDGGKDHDGYVISGTIVNATASQIFLEEVSGSRPVIIDTATIGEDGSYQMKGYLNQPGLYRVKFDAQRFVLMLLHDEKVTLDVDVNNLGSYIIKGASYGNAMKLLMGKVNYTQKQIASMQAQFRQVQKSPNGQQQAKVLEQEYSSLMMSYTGYLKGFIDTVQNPMMGVFAAGMLDAKQDSKYLKGYASKISSLSSTNPFVANFVSRINSYVNIEIGQVVPDISMPTPQGNIISLSDLRGKVVLIDFWAAWCRPCRMANPHLVQVYQKYKDKGFEVFSVSLDKTKARWVQAIAQDNLTWDYHVSDLKYWQSEAAQLYNVSSIPATFLIDADGKLIAQNIRGLQIEQKLDEIFGG